MRWPPWSSPRAKTSFDLPSHPRNNMENSTEEAAILSRLKQAFSKNDSATVRQLLEQHPAFKSKINEPIGAFDAPIVTQVRSREMLDVLLDVGADINAKSRWWAGGFGLLHLCPPD